ncbi:MAG: hypothetical protein M3032_10775 [Verrucomicrobiota bacterium]|nr:hypothetical protein [Verrucomicrobiota bacterium]
MKLLSMRTHLVIDSILGVIFLVSPFAFGFINGPTHQWCRTSASACSRSVRA